MKQRINGQRVINWHRPLRKDDLRQRYVRLRYAPVAEDLDITFDPFKPEPCNEYCTCESCNPYDHYDYREDYSATPFDQVLHEAKAFLSRPMNNQLQFLVSPEVLRKLQNVSTYSASPIRSLTSPVAIPPQPRFSSKQLGPALAEFLKQDLSAAYGLKAIPITLDYFKDNEKDLETLQAIGSEAEAIEAALCVWIHKPFWVRPLESWADPGVFDEGRSQSLLEHLFCVYPVPGFFFKNWAGRWKDPFPKWMQWFILLGQGGSLHGASSHFKWSFSKSIVPYFLRAPAHISVANACLYAEIVRLGGGPIEFKRIRRNRSHVFDPTDFRGDPKFLPYWRNTVSWLIKNRNEITDGDANEILTWAMHQRIEARRWRREPFSMAGRSVARVMEASIAYAEERALPYSTKKWKAKGWDWKYKTPQGVTWTMEELLTGQALFQEGRAMRHCVGSYSMHCYTQRSAIFSLKCEGERVLTIEINLRNHRITQAYGVRNRQKSEEEAFILDKWWDKVSQTPFSAAVIPRAVIGVGYY